MPGICRRVVDVVQIRIVGVIRGAPADNMDSPVHDNHSHVVAGRAQAARLGSIFQSKCHRPHAWHSYLVESAPSDRVDLAIDHSHADRSARAAERRQLPPSVSREIVFENKIESSNMDILVKPPIA